MTTESIVALIMSGGAALIAFLAATVVALVSWTARQTIDEFKRRVGALEVVVESQRKIAVEHGEALAGHQATSDAVEQRLDALHDGLSKVQDGINTLLTRAGFTPRGTPAHKP